MTDPQGEKSESDVQSEKHESRSRPGRDDDGSYVGRTSTDDDFDAGETGAEARSQES